MKDMLIILGMIIAAGVVGAYLYFYTPADLASPYVTPVIATSSEPAAASAQSPATVSFTTLNTGTRAAQVTARKNYAAGDATGLEKLWALAFGANATSTPAINFDKQEVIGIFAGEKPTGGYAIKVTKVEDSATERTIHIALVVPGAKCVTTQSVTSPYTIISLPLSSLPLAHQDATSTSECK